MGNQGCLRFPDREPGGCGGADQPRGRAEPSCSMAANPPLNLCFIEEHRGIVSGCV